MHPPPSSVEVCHKIDQSLTLMKRGVYVLERRGTGLSSFAVSFQSSGE
jgi:hypothetical protein